MTASGEGSDQQLAPALSSVAEAAGARLRAEVKEDSEAVLASTKQLKEAATAAIGAGFGLTEVAGAEALGKTTVRRELGRSALERVERSALNARESQAKHHRAIARAMRLGLSTREIAAAAGVTHGTIRAISSRVSGAASALSDAAGRPVGSGD